MLDLCLLLSKCLPGGLFWVLIALLLALLFLLPSLPLSTIQEETLTSTPTTHESCEMFDTHILQRENSWKKSEKAGPHQYTFLNYLSRSMAKRHHWGKYLWHKNADVKSIVGCETTHNNVIQIYDCALKYMGAIYKLSCLQNVF